MVAGMTSVGHDGGQQGTSTSIVLVPEQDLGVVVLTNMDGLNASALATDLLAILLGGSAKTSEPAEIRCRNRELRGDIAANSGFHVRVLPLANRAVRLPSSLSVHENLKRQRLRSSQAFE